MNAQTDTLLVTPTRPVTNEAASVEAEKLHSAHKATLYSAVLPGLGQAYNRKYWKIPLVYAALGGVVYGLSFNNKYYNIYKNAYRDFITRDPANISYVDLLGPGKLNLTQEQVETTRAEWFQSALRNKRTYYKRNRDLSIIGLAAVYVLNMIDASVDAHFFNYDISDDLTIHVMPEVNTNPYLRYQSPPTLGMQVSIKF